MPEKEIQELLRTVQERRAAKQFAADWRGHGNEKQEM